MHEMSYSESVLEAVLRRASGRPVAGIGVRIGAFHRVVEDAFEQSFQMAAMGTAAEGAMATVTQIPGQARCWECSTEFDAPLPSPACPSCGSFSVRVEGGDEVMLEWLEYREALDDGHHEEPELIAPHTHDDHDHSHDHEHAGGGR